MKRSSTDVVAASDVGTTATPAVRSRRSPKLMWGSIPATARRIALVLVLLFAWHLYVLASGVSPLVFAGPVDVFGAFVAGVIDGEIVTAALTTLQVLLAGMALGTLVATVLTTLAMWTKLGEDLLVSRVDSGLTVV